VNVTSNKLLVFNDRRERDGCSVSRAQAVKAFSPGCLPWILPSSDTSAFAAQGTILPLDHRCTLLGLPLSTWLMDVLDFTMLGFVLPFSPEDRCSCKDVCIHFQGCKSYQELYA
jgi:hypothetical protein